MPADGLVVSCAKISMGDPPHSRAACTQPCDVNTHSRAHCSPGARLCEQWGHGCVNNGARLCASARLCRGSPVISADAMMIIFQCRRYTYQHFNSSLPGSAFIKPDQRNPWIKDQIKITLLPTISHLLLPNFVSCGRACPSHMTQNLVTVGAKLWTADRFIVDPWSMDYADPVW